MPTRFVITTLGAIPHPDDGEAWQWARIKISRGFSLLLEENNEVLYFGAGEGWWGKKNSGRFSLQSVMRFTPIFAVNVAGIWLAQFLSGLVWGVRSTPVVILAGTPLAGVGFALAKVFAPGLPLVLRIQGFRPANALFVKSSRWRYWFLCRIESFVVRRADLVLPVYHWLRGVALSHGANPERVLLMPTAVPWGDAAEVSTLPRDPTVLFVGRLDREKGVDLLLRAMGSVKGQVPNAGLLIAGTGNQRSELERMVASLGLSDRVSFLGWLNPGELMQAYRNSSVLILPSVTDEGLGMVLIEAGLMGRPVICSGTGGMCDVVRDGKSGLLVPRGSVTELAAAIVRVLRDVPLATRMGLAGREIAEKYLADREVAIERVRASFAKIAGR